jgi:heavy metal sensor kinase
MAFLLGAAGMFLYTRLGTELLRTIDSALRAQAEVVAAGIQEGGNFGDQGRTSTGGIETFIQVVDASGRILESTEAMAGVRLVGQAEVASAAGPRFLERKVGGEKDPVRLLIIPASESGERLFVVAGASLEGRQEVLTRFMLLLVIGGPIALAVASAAGWAMAGAALRPVERMRQEAAAISVSDRDRRLPVPDSGDEIGRLGETMNAMLDRLSIAFTAERRFVEDASHELRTPLTNLKTELDIALSRHRTRRQLEGALRSASEEADRLAALAKDLLLYSRADGGRFPLHREEVRLDELLGEARSALTTRAAAAGVAVEVQAPSETIRVDRARLRQAVDNLLSNSLRHTPPAGRIVARVVPDGTGLRLIVEDTGSGFPTGFLDRAFEPFARGPSERAGAPEGAGLGLAIVRAVAESHGGRAIAENRPEGGARVTLVLRVGE